MPGGKLAPLLVAARSSYYLPMMLGRRGGLARRRARGSIWPWPGFSLVLGTGIGKKIIGDEKKRQQTYRQQQAKGAVRRFIDEVAFVLNKETRDVLRTAQRHLRDDFQGRAKQLERSAYEAMEAARRLGGLDEAQLAARERELHTGRVSWSRSGPRPARWRALGRRWAAVADPLVDNLGALLDRAVSSAAPTKPGRGWSMPASG